MKRRNFKSFVVEVFQGDSIGICTEVDEKFHIFDELPFDKFELMGPKHHLKDL
jgi:hypothetical protein